MKKLRLLSFATIFASTSIIVACGDDDDDNQICAICSDETSEQEICAETQTELDALTDTFLNNAEGNAICIENQ